MDGYDRLAAVIGRYGGMAIFKRFAMLNAKNLLYMQQELVHLDQQLKNLAFKDANSGEKGRASYQYSFVNLKCSLGKDGEDAQWRKVLEIREKLKAYSEYNFFFQTHPHCSDGRCTNRSGFERMMRYCSKPKSTNSNARMTPTLKVFETGSNLRAAATASWRAEKQDLGRLRTL
jgi:hypothetical protein